MEKKIPGPLWIALISLGLMVLGKVLVALTSGPVILVDAVLSGLLLAGLVFGHKWAYVLTFIFTAIGTVAGLSQGAEAGIAILVLDCLVLVPVLISTRYFFPESPPAPAADRQAQ